METIPGGARVIQENGELEKMSMDLRGFLGHLAGPTQGPDPTRTSTAVPAGPISIATTGMLPIKLSTGKARLADEGIVPVMARNLLEDDEVDEKDTVLLSRSESLADRTRAPTDICVTAKGVPIITAPSIRKVNGSRAYTLGSGGAHCLSGRQEHLEMEQQADGARQTPANRPKSASARTFRGKLGARHSLICAASCNCSLTSF